MDFSGTIAAGDAAGTAGRSRLRCWGDFAVSDASSGSDLKPRGRKARALLAYLALHPDKPLSRERLTGVLWGDRAEEQARASLRQAIFELKPFTNGGPSLLTVDRDHVVLNSVALVTDIDELRDVAQRGDFDALLRALPDPDDQLFADLDGLDSGFDDWLAIERTRQRDALTELVASAAAAAKAGGQIREARALLIRLHELDPDSDEAAAVAPPGRIEPKAARDAARLAGGAENAQRWRIAMLVALLLTFSVLAIGAWQFQRVLPATPTAIAVLPFENLSDGGDAYFAEGVSEEILGQLARNPGLKVMGRTSAWSFKDQRLDAPTLGRRLDVAYLVEGSVRTAGPNVRVNVSLVRARDGTQIWSERYDGLLDDIFAIQDQIGSAVSTRLRGGASAQSSGIVATRGDVYALYLTARGLIRDREMAKMDAAIELLQRAVRLDPQFAPAWASLGSAVQMRWGPKGDPETEATVRAESLDHIDRALRLQPDLAEAHAAKAMILNFKGAEARASIERAVRLDPNSAQNWYWMANVRVGIGDYPGALAALRRSVAIDPLWHRAFAYASRWAWAMGHREEAIGYMRRVERDGAPLPFQAHMVRSEMAEWRGDLSGAAAHAKAALDVADEGKRRFALGLYARAIWALGDPRTAQRIVPIDDEIFALRMGRPPSREAMGEHYAGRQAGYVDAPSAWDDGDFIPLAIRLLSNAGRSAELVELYDLHQGSPAKMARDSVDHASFVAEAPIVALALREANREAEADALLTLADLAVGARLRRGRVPHWYHVACAEIWAVRGDRVAALAALDRAVGLGWMPIEFGALRDIADQPAFRSLRGDPRFERIRARLRAHFDRERRELGPI